MKEIYKVYPNDACLGVDPTETFFPNGELPVPGGNLIIPVGKMLMQKFRPTKIYFSEDEHPLGHISRADSYIGVKNGTLLTPELVADWTKKNLAPHTQFSIYYLKWYLHKIGSQMAWQPHGLPDSQRTRVSPDLLEYGYRAIIVKGQDPRVDSYSAVKDALGASTGLTEILRHNKIIRIFVWGLAFDYCVGLTAFDLAKEGFTVFVVQDATASVNYPTGSAEAMHQRLLDVGVILIDQDQVKK